VAAVLDADAVQGWVDRYERAWRTAGTELLDDLFDADATYQTAPFDPPHMGIGAIRVLWDAEREGPDEPFTMTSSVVAVTDPVAVVRLEVEYGRSGQVFRDLWVLRFGPDGRCVAFEEWPFWPRERSTGPAE
jgi:hypothetical protein